MCVSRKEEGQWYRTYLRRFVRRVGLFPKDSPMQSVKWLSNSFYLWICQISQRAMPYFTTAYGLFLVEEKILFNLE